MDEMNAIKLAQQLLERHGVKKSACVEGGKWTAADGYVLNLTGMRTAEAAEMLAEAAEKKAPVAVVTGNAGNTELVMAALSGAGEYQALYEACGCPVFTAESLDALCSKQGLAWTESVSCGEAVNAAWSANPLNADGTSIGHAVRQIVKQRSVANEPYLIRLYCPAEQVADRKEAEQKPFLSVIIRTMGTRILALREGLLCLMAQTDQDFEILIVAHKAEKKNLESLKQLIAEEPESNRKRIRLLTCNEGKRAVPINLALQHARGEYFAIFDDDDILFDNWVEAYHEAAKEAPGRILHQYCVAQPWESFEMEGEECLVSSGALNNIYCDDFRFVRQMKHNNCPLMCLGFPTALYSKLGYAFDESLDVCEDWEYLMRVVSFCGTAEAGRVVGAIYRHWKNVTNSTALFDQDYWRRTERRIFSLMDENTVVMPGEGAKALRDLYVSAGSKEMIFDTALYIDRGHGFTENDVVRKAVFQHGDEFYCEYDVAGMRKGKLQRWDPISSGVFVLWDLCIIGVDANGTEIELPVKQCNGIEGEGRYVFDNTDPQLYFLSPRKAELKKVIITSSVRCRFSGAEIDEVRRPTESSVQTIAALQGQIAALNDQSRQQTQVIDQLNYTIRDQVTSIQELRHLSERRGAYIEEQDALIRDQTTSLQTLSNRNGELEQAIGQLNYTVREQDAMIQELRHLSESRGAYIEEQNALIHNQAASLNELRNLCEARELIIRDRDENLAQHRAALNGMQETVAAKNEVISAQSGLIRDQQVVYEQHKTELADMRAEYQNGLARRDQQLSEMTSGLVQRDQQIAELNNRLAERCQTVDELNNRLAERCQTVDVLNAQIQAYIHSTSWKVTRPMRGVKKVLRKTLGFDKEPGQASLLVRGVRYYRKNGLRGTLRRILKGAQVSRPSGSQEEGHAAPPPTSLMEALGRHPGTIYDEASLRACMETEKPYSYRVLFVSHEMSLTGAPVVLLNFAKTVKESGNQPVLLAPVDGPLRAEAEKAGVPVIVMPDLFAAQDILDIAYPFNAVVANTIASAAVVKALNGTDIPVIWWIHEAKVSYHLGVLREMPEKLESNVHVYSVCEYARTMLSQYRPTYQSELLPYYMDDFADVESSSDFKLPAHKGKTVFTMVGAMEERKGQDILVQAIRLLPKQVRDKCLFVIVAKKYHKPYEEMIDQLCADYPQNVLYYEQLSRDEIANLYRESDCQICSSRDDPLPCVITEALAVGKPAICSENTGYAAILSEMNSGLVYRKDNPQLLAQAIERYMVKPTLQRKLAGNARRTYEKYFTRAAFSESANTLLNRHVLKLLPEEAENPALRGKTLQETMELTSPASASVSVVIPTWNPGASFEQLLDMLEKQKGVNKLEIVIVDSGSKDDTVHICKKHGVKLIEIPNTEFSHSGARNMGAKAASGDILLFMTQDALPASKDWVQRLIEPILHKNVAAVSPMEKCPPDTDLYYRVASSIHSAYLSNNRADKLNEGMGNGDRSAFRARSALNDVTTAINRRIFMRFLYRHDFAEDLDMGMRLIRSGYRLMMMSSVQTIHGHNRAAGYYFKRTLVDTVTTSETILQVPIRGTAGQTALCEMLAQGYGAMQQVYQQVLSDTYKNLHSFEQALDKAFDAADQMKVAKMMSADNCKAMEDPILMEVVGILRQHCEAQAVPHREVVNALRGYWQNQLLPFMKKEGKWNSDSALELLQCLNKHLACTLGCELARLATTDEAYVQLQKFTAGV